MPQDPRPVPAPDPAPAQAQAPASSGRSAFLPAALALVRGLRGRFDARAKALDMTYSRAQALLVIARHEGLSQAEIASRLDIATPSVNRTLDHLEAAGLIQRRPCAQDKRLNRLHLTPKAETLAARIIAFTEELRDEIFDGIPEAELEQALAVIARLQANLDRMA